MPSANNPFRSPAVSVNGTGASTTSQAPPLPPRPPLIIPNATEASSSTSTVTADSHPETTNHDRLEVEDLQFEEPPAYSPVPDVRHGEETLELGPRRPFQPAPPRPSGGWTPQVQPQQSGVGARYNGSTSGGNRSSSSINRPNSASQSRPSSNVQDDGRPTNTPVPGHPLLYDRHVLIYPSGYICPKCLNTGYKPASCPDPTHPCRSCWRKFSKPFTGPITYATFSGNSSFDGGNKSLQRPLPMLRPPQSRFNDYRQQQRLAPPPPPRPIVQELSPYGGYNAPPPGSLVVGPGDPRIGGQLCWRCGGDGQMSILFGLDSVNCMECNGVGRLF